MHARAPRGSTCLPWSLPSITASSRGSPDAGDRVGDTKALGEVASSFKYPLGQPPCCLDGDHYCFRGTGKGRELRPGSGIPEGPTLFTPQGLRWGPGPWEAALNVPLLSPHGRGAGSGGRPSPAPQLVLGPHLRQPGGLKGGREAVSAPPASQLGSKPSPKIKKYFGELKSAQGGDGLEGAGSGRSSKGALVFDKGGPLAPALVLF